MSESRLFTSESVSMGHPDKVSDQISDAILDAMLARDPKSRVAVETLVATGLVVVAGEVTTDGYVEIQDIVRGTIREIGYTSADMRFDAESCAVMVALNTQSPEIAQGVDKEGAGDQGMMFGFACKETPELMPLPIQLSHRLVERQAQVRREKLVEGLRPDAKSQVTVEYGADGRPSRVRTVVLSTQHGPRWTKDQATLKGLVVEQIIKPVLGEWWNDDITVHMNPTGSFEIGGPHGDAGLTGRKIIVDTYGGRGRHGGGAFSGKDPTKVDRSAAYMARYIAKNLVAAGLAEECEVQLSYAIGVAEPTSVRVDTVGATVEESKINKAVREIFDLSPRGIINSLELRNPIYGPSARHGHFGREPGAREYTFTETNGTAVTVTPTMFTWERTDKADALRKAVGG